MLNLPSPENYDVGEKIKIILSSDHSNSNHLLIVCDALILLPENPRWDREGRNRGSSDEGYNQTNICFNSPEQTIKRFIFPGYTGGSNYVIKELAPHGYLSLICINDKDNDNEKIWYVADTTASSIDGTLCAALFP